MYKLYSIKSLDTYATRYEYNLPILKSPKPAPNAIGALWSVLWNVSYHEVYHYIWLIGGDLNGFPDMMPLMM